MSKNRHTGRPIKHTVGTFDFYEVFDGNRSVATELMLPAGTRIRRVGVA
jgi:hypothetical protein